MRMSGTDGRILVISTGGTIANTEHHGRLPIEDVIADVRLRHPELPPDVPSAIEVQEVTREAAENFTPETWLAIAAAVQAGVDRDDVRAVVVTHGTYTVEETAYYLHLTVDTEKAIVVTCAQRKHGSLGNDGDRNLIDALRVAATGEAAGLGVLLVVNEEIHSAREVIKVSRRPDGFVAPFLGALGSVDEDRVTLYRAPLRRHTHRSELRRPSATDMPEVAVVAAYPGAPAGALAAAVGAGASGIVIQGYAFSGRTTPAQQAMAEEVASSGVPVVLVSRGREGRVPVPTVPDPFVRGDNLATSKAVVLLTAAIAAGHRDRDALQHLFDTH